MSNVPADGPPRSEGTPACCAPARETEAAEVDRAGAAAASPLDKRGNQRPAVPSLAADLVDLPGGAFLMGTDDHEGFPSDGEGPVREVTVSPFRISRYAVSNRRFAEFVEDSGYVSEAERIGWSFVFYLFVTRIARKRRQVREVPGLRWWLAVEGACWKRPEGKGSHVRDRADHPVVHVSHRDALAYSAWAGARLPTEAEWEYAARGGLVQKRFAWGDELTPGGRHMCNIWQGRFPEHNSAEDGWSATCPVDCFEPNGFGLYNVAGNVWEWCADWWSATWHLNGPRHDPRGPTSGDRRVTRGGSYLCHHSYCNRYRVAARSSNTPDSASGNTGFRVAADVPGAAAVDGASAAAAAKSPPVADRGAPGLHSAS